MDTAIAAHGCTVYWGKSCSLGLIGGVPSTAALSSSCALVCTAYVSNPGALRGIDAALLAGVTDHTRLHLGDGITALVSAFRWWPTAGRLLPRWLCGGPGL